MKSVISTFVIILAYLLIGRLLVLSRRVPENAANALNLVVLNACLPAAILLYAPRLTAERELLELVAVPWVLLLASIAFVFPLARFLKLERGTQANLLVQVPLGNTSFIGYSLIPVLAGAGTLRYAVVYDQLGSFLILSTWGLFVIATHAGGARPRFGEIARRVLGFPPFIALAVALTVMPAEPASFVEAGLKLLADALLPIVALALGMELRLRLPPDHRMPLVIGLFGKLLLMPLLALGLCRWLGLSGEIGLVAVYLSAMPPMMTSGALLSSAGLAPGLSATLVGYGTLLSMITLPLWYWILNT